MSVLYRYRQAVEVSPVHWEDGVASLGLQQGKGKERRSVDAGLAY